MLKAIETSYLKYAVVFIAGAVLALAFSPVNFYLFAVFSPAVLFYFLLSTSSRQAAWLGWWFGMGFFGIGVSWGFIAIYVFGLSSIFISTVLTFIGISIMAAFIALQGYLSVSFIQKIKLKNQTVILLIVFPKFESNH